MSIRERIAAVFRPKTMIFTSRGMLDVELLVKTEGFVENENERTTWQEWRMREDLGSELVKREAQIHLKKGLAVFSHAGTIGS